MAAYASAGVTLPHSTAELAAHTVAVGPAGVRPGDLVFYGEDGPVKVAVYVGDGEVIGAFRTGTKVHVEAVGYETVFASGRVTQP